MITRFFSCQGRMLRFATDLSAPSSNNEAEHTLRPVKIQQPPAAAGTP